MDRAGASIAVIAHRGASRLVGEDNTLRSFARAIEIGCDYVEFDVRRCRDELICFHDGHAGRSPVAKLTLAELRERTGLAVPRLKEVLDFCRGRIGLDVELKDTGLEAEVLSALRAVADDTPLLVKSLDRGVVAALLALAPPCPVGLLVGPPAPGPGRRKALKAAVAACRTLHANFLSPHHSLLADEALARAELQGIPAYPWTVNDPATMARLAALPIRGMITDRPDLLLEIVRKAH